MNILRAPLKFITFFGVREPKINMKNSVRFYPIYSNLLLILIHLFIHVTQ